MAGDQKIPFKIIDGQPTGQESISKLELGDFDLRHI